MIKKLYHGSSVYCETLIPHIAYDWGYEEGCKNAVYATSNKSIALSFALGIQADSNGETERIMDPEYGDKMVFWKGTPNYKTCVSKGRTGGLNYKLFMVN